MLASPGMSRPTKRADETEVTVQQLMLPEHANALGNVHGGVIMKLCDEAAAICAMRHSQRPSVTVAIDSVAFHSPVHVGQLLALHARLAYVGKTSMELRVQVHAEDLIAGRITHTNSAYLVFVALDEFGKPAQVPGLELLTEADQKAWDDGAARQSRRRTDTGL